MNSFRVVRGMVLAAAVASVLVLRISAEQGSPARQVSLVITGGTVVTMDGGRRVLSPGAVAIDGDRIVGVGTPDEISRAVSSRRVIDATGKIVLPGLINTHGHAPMVLYRGLADDLALMEWLEKYIFPAEAKTVSPEMVRIGTRLAALEMIQSGTTTFADMYYFEEEIAKAASAAGLRAVLGQTIIRFPVADARTPQEGLKRTEAFIKAFKGDPLITPAVAPHSPYTEEKATLLACRDLALQYDVPLLIHLAETEEEVRIIKDRAGLTPTGYLESIGFFTPRTLAAHGVWVTDEDIAILKRRGVGVAHNPESNMKLASGTAPVPKYLAAGVALGLGTDGAASNNDLDMFEAMRQAAFLHKLQSRDPRVVAAPTALEMATLGGARALGMEREIGSLETGKRADVIVVGMRRARQTPRYDALSHLVYATHGDDVETTIVNGQVLMQDRKVLTLDEPEVLREAEAFAVKVRAAVIGSPERPATSLADALKNLAEYKETRDAQASSSFQFDAKGVEFGPWLRRFIAHVKRNWHAPSAAMSIKGHVVITFNVHKNGALTDLTVAGPSAVKAFNDAAFNALATSNPTEPLPREYPDGKAFFTVTFYYNEPPPEP